MVCPSVLPPGRSQRGAAVGLAFALALAPSACGRVSLGSTDEVDDRSGGSDGGAGSAGAAGDTGDDPSAPPGRGGAGAPPAVDDPSGGVDSGAGGTSGEGDGADAGPARPLPPSCAARDPRCGGEGASCCESLLVTGGSFTMQDLFSTDAAVTATVSSFRLDRFEVTVGRMREFVARYDELRQLGQPEEGAGAHPRIADSGWQTRFAEQLPATAAELDARLRECSPLPPSTYADGSSDEVPLNCVSWFEAAAFCAWDGGRLPTMRELAYAAAGGALQRLYPWGDEPVPRREIALFGCIIDAESPVCTIADVTPAGSHPLGAGFFGQEDLAGSMAEWVLDTTGPLEPCTDCAALADQTLRLSRASSWIDGADLMTNGRFFPVPPEVRTNFIGLRCARDE